MLSDPGHGLSNQRIIAHRVWRGKPSLLDRGWVMGRPVPGRVIEGLDRPAPVGTVRFHAGTKRDGERWVTAGGRVLNVVARGAGLPEALELAYVEADAIRFEGKQVRLDIGKAGVQG